MKTRVFIVDDHRVVRDCMTMILQPESDIVVVGGTNSGLSAVQLIAGFNPDVVLMDIYMPDLDGIQATRQLRSQFPDLRIVIVSAYSKQELVQEALQAGACGFVAKLSTAEELSAAIRTVAAGKIYLSPDISANILDHHIRQCAHSGGARGTSLTPREREVFELVGRGLTTKEIAIQLHISARTVDTYRSRLRSKAPSPDLNHPAQCAAPAAPALGDQSGGGAEQSVERRAGS
jgi:DNA-binding NarL/FixJ family response regulator